MAFTRLDRQRLIVLGVAAVSGVLLVTFLNRYMQQERHSYEQEKAKMLEQIGRPVPVVVATQDIPEGAALEAKLLATKEFPERFVQPFAAKMEGDVVGRIATVTIAEGEQILMNKLRRPEDPMRMTTLSSIMPEGKRAITVGVDTLTGVGGFVQPGDHVDILWAVKVPGPTPQEASIATLTLFQGVRVLAVGPSVYPVRPAGAQEAQQGGDRLEKPFTVTLALTPQEASLLSFARQQGPVQLSLRPKGDAEPRGPIPPADINALIVSVLGPEAASLTRPAQPKTVEIYKGLEKSVEAVPPE